jgi:hypothetical protein
MTSSKFADYSAVPVPLSHLISLNSIDIPLSYLLKEMDTVEVLYSYMTDSGKFRWKVSLFLNFLFQAASDRKERNFIYSFAV